MSVLKSIVHQGKMSQMSEENNLKSFENHMKDFIKNNSPKYNLN